MNMRSTVIIGTAMATWFIVTFVAIGPPFVGRSSDPVESKVVELHITLADTAVETKKTTQRIQPVGGKAVCSGAFVDGDGLILTARHCVEGVAGMEVLTSDHAVYTASFVAKSNSHDLALVRIDRHSTPFFELATETKRGEHISVLGSPMGEIGTLSQGFIAKLEGDRLIIDASVAPGNSGGPVYDDTGRLVGVAVAVFVCEYGMTHLGSVESADAVRAFLKLVQGRKMYAR
jgi:S1-C subfamily serine protease